VAVSGVDLNEVGRSSEDLLTSRAALHKCSVRPRGRRTLSVYQPYLVRQKTETVSLNWREYKWPLFAAHLCTSTNF